MATPQIKKAIFLKNELPAISSDNTYRVRFRVVSEDKNRVSAWSSIFSLNGVSPTEVNSEAIINDKIITLVWDDTNNTISYDIFVKFDGGPYAYHGTSIINNYSLINSGTTSFQYALQISSISKERVAELEIYESEEISLV